MEDIGCAHDPNVLKIRGMAGANGLLEEGGQITVTRGSCRKGRETRGESAMGQMHWCGAPPAMKVGEPATHMYLAPALARRALTVEEKRGEERMVWRKALSLFFYGAEQAMDVWVLQVRPLYSKPMAGPQRPGAIAIVCTN
jgi:hypothetical protein